MKPVEVIHTAIKNGCRPEYHPGYGWCCGCKDGLHHGDQQSSLLSAKSCKKKRPGALPWQPESKI